MVPLSRVPSSPRLRSSALQRLQASHSVAAGANDLNARTPVPIEQPDGLMPRTPPGPTSPTQLIPMQQAPGLADVAPTLCWMPVHMAQLDETRSSAASIVQEKQKQVPDDAQACTLKRCSKQTRSIECAAHRTRQSEMTPCIWMLMETGWP